MTDTIDEQLARGIRAEANVQALLANERSLMIEIARMRAALEIIAGRRQCIDNLLSNADVARLALDHK